MRVIPVQFYVFELADTCAEIYIPWFESYMSRFTKGRKKRYSKFKQTQEKKTESKTATPLKEDC